MILGVSGGLNYLGKGPEGLFYMIELLSVVLILEVLFLANILWAKKGTRAMVKTVLALSVFRTLTLALPLGIEKATLKELTAIPVDMDYMPALIGTIVLEGVSFFGFAWILNRRFFEKIPLLIGKLLAGILTGGILAYALIMMVLDGKPAFLCAAALCLAFGSGGALLWCQRRIMRGEFYFFRQQGRIFEDYSVALDRQNNIVRQMSYDMNGYLADMKRLVKKNDSKAMDEATWKMQQEYGKLAFVEYSNNRSVNALLHRKLEVCRARKIRTQVDLAQFEGGFVENTDWLAMFFCLFDNAIEACVGMEPGRERFIRVKAKCASGFEVLVFLNSRQPGLKSRDGRHTTKGNSSAYGMGLHILEEIVGKYGGTVICKEEKDTFQTTVSLQVREKRR